MIDESNEPLTHKSSDADILRAAKDSIDKWENTYGGWLEDMERWYKMYNGDQWPEVEKTIREAAPEGAYAEVSRAAREGVLGDEALPLLAQAESHLLEQEEDPETFSRGLATLVLLLLAVRLKTITEAA